MLNAGAGGRAPQMGIVTSGGHVAGSLWRSCGEGGLVEKLVLIVGGFSGQSENSCFMMQHWWCDASKNRELVDWSGVQAT